MESIGTSVVLSLRRTARQDNEYRIDPVKEVP